VLHRASPVPASGAQVEERLRAHLRATRSMHARDCDVLLAAFRSVHTVRCHASQKQRLVRVALFTYGCGCGDQGRL
jgi:hypothetical protein